MRRNCSKITLLSIFNLYTLIPLYLILSSCNPSKHLGEKQYLLTKNKIVTDDPAIPKSELASYVRQKPNRKIFGFFRFHLAVYSLVNKEKLEARQADLDQQQEVKNKKRIEKGLKPKQRKPGIRERIAKWLMNIGEEPVVFDSTLTQSTVKQFSIFMKNKGFFNAVVKDSVYYRKKKARVVYLIHEGKPYTLGNISFVAKDSAISAIIALVSNNSLLKKGDNYDVDIMQKERERITRELKERGYFLFTKEYIYFNADSVATTRTVDLTLYIKNRGFISPDNPDSVIELNHDVYHINNVYVNSDFNPKSDDNITNDSLFYNNYCIIYKTALKHKPEIILKNIFIKKHDLYMQSNVEETYKRLSDLRAWRYINIQFGEVAADTAARLLNCYIQLTPVAKQSIGTDAQGTNTAGNLGISGNISYYNKNIFRGAELFELRLKGGLESQILAKGIPDKKIPGLPLFNTIEYGPEANLYLPKLLWPFNVSPFTGLYNLKTVLHTSYNFQQNPYFTRAVEKATYGYSGYLGRHHKFIFNPFEVNYVYIYNKSAALDTYVASLKDQLLRNSYNSHLTTSASLNYIFSNQQLGSGRNFSYWDVKLEWAGNLLRLMDNLLKAKKDTLYDYRFFDYVKDTVYSYKLFKITYAQYVKTTVDYRHYFVINKNNRIAVRAAGGIGVAFYNLGVLPLESRFFGGGANGIRAWRARSLGPGAFVETSNIPAFDKFGDMKLEGNIEYRFGIYKFVKGASFVDMGNIWLTRENNDRPGGEFKLNRFYKDIAVGGGFGIRLDFSFFIIRFDAAIPLKNPALPDGEKWFKDLAMKKVNFQLGIGYPF